MEFNDESISTILAGATHVTIKYDKGMRRYFEFKDGKWVEEED